VLEGSGPSDSGGLGVSSGMSGINGMAGRNGDGTAGEASACLLVEATVEFLKEFVVDDDKARESKGLKGKTSMNANVNGKVVWGLGSGSSSRAREVGKARRQRAKSFHSPVVPSSFPCLWCWRRCRPLVLMSLLNFLVILVRISNDRCKNKTRIHRIHF
jgi:hypothetical protein